MKRYFVRCSAPQWDNSCLARPLWQEELNYSTTMLDSSTSPVDFKPLLLSFPQSHPPFFSFFLSVNMSGEEHKKGRVSELEGQQRASGRAMFLLSGALREGAKREAGNEGGKEPEEKWISLFSPHLARERRGQSSLAILPGPFLPLLLVPGRPVP